MGHTIEKPWTPEELAAHLRVHPKSIRLWLRSGRIKGAKIGRLWRIEASEVQRFLQPTGTEQ